MDRLAELISKLKEQFEHNADHTQLLVTTHMIEDELMRSVASTKQVKTTSKIAVVMPAGRKHFQPEEEPAIPQSTSYVQTSLVHRVQPHVWTLF